jgi:hypothetical protein
MFHPMPSPRGTNRERLFVHWPTRSPTMAFDSAAGVADHPDEIEQLLEFLKGKLSDEDMQQVQKIVASRPEALDDARPEPDLGKLTNAGKQALDHLSPALRRQAIDAVMDQRSRAAKSFASRWPEIARIVSV